MKVARLALAAARNVYAFRRRFLGLALLTGIGLGVCVSLLTVSTSAQGAVRRNGTQGAVLRAIQVTNYTDRANLKRLTTDNLTSIRALPGVTDIQPALQATFGIKTEEVPGVLLYANIPQSATLPPIVHQTRTNIFPLHPGEAVVPAEAGGISLEPLLGKSIPVEVQQTTGPGTGEGATSFVTVVALSDPTWQVYGPDSAFVASDLVQQWAAMRDNVNSTQLTSMYGYDSALVIAHDSAQVPALVKQLQAMGYAAASRQQQLQSLPGILQLLDEAGKALLVILAIMVALGTATLAAALVRQRTHEIGIMKALGFANYRIGLLLSFELLIVAASACLMGLLLSIPGSLLVTSLARSVDGVSGLLPSGVLLPAAPVALFCAGALVLSVLAGAIVPLVRVARLEPADALRAD